MYSGKQALRLEKFKASDIGGLDKELKERKGSGKYDSNRTPYNIELINYDGPTLEKATAILNELHTPFIINQNSYNILNRTIENNGLKSTAAKLGKGIICFSPLAQGLLTDRYLKDIPEDSRVKKDGRFLKEKNVEDNRKVLIKLNEIAAARNQTLAEMALAWILKDSDITSVLIGASRPAQILDNIKALENTSFSKEELDAIDKLTLNK